MSTKRIEDRLQHLLLLDIHDRNQDGSPLYKEHRVFTNRSLKMSRMQAIGFDMDFTLAQYNQEALDRTTMELALGHLVNQGYPEGILEIEYLPNFAIRGLIVDKESGNILKMDKFRYVSLAWHGLKPLDIDERGKLYNISRINVSSRRFQPVDTLFELLEAYLYAALITFLEDRGDDVDFNKLYDDLRGAIDLCHRDNSLKNAMMAHPERFIQDDPQLIQALHQFKTNGKRLFVLTNSEPHYTEFVLTYLFRNASPYFRNWRSCFELVGSLAGKPRFFDDGSPVTIIEEKPTLFFSGGNLAFLEEQLQVQQDRLLYVGDHIYGDILKSKHKSQWRTCLIVPELNHQIRAEEGSRPLLEQLVANEGAHKKTAMELNQYRALVQELHQFKESESDELKLEHLNRIDDRIVEINRMIEEKSRNLSDALSRSNDLRRQVALSFNPYWGRLFKTGEQLSMFAEQIRDYACIYTSSVSNFNYHNNGTFYNAMVTPMPHEKDMHQVSDLNFDAPIEAFVEAGGTQRNGTE